MVLPISIALSLSILYRITINLPDLPYSAELRRAGSDDFLETSKHLNQVVDQLLQNLPGEHRSSVNKFSYHQVIGTLATFDIYSDENSEYVRQAFLKAIEKGFIGHYAVSSDGFELHVIQASNTNCSALEFPCSDGTCISSKLQCDHSRDCPDGSDESAKFAHCKHHIPVIYQTDKIFSVPVGGVAHLSAIIDMLEENHQVIWTRHSNIIGENSLVLSDDDRISLSHSKDEYFLRIKNVVESDAGEYSIQIQGLPVNATFEIRITADAIPKESDECPEGERACKSGHCLPVSQFCDRITQCPDGDDEMNCTAVVCSSTEIRCLSNNVCVPASARCDGWKDCQDASDEEGCPAATTSRPITHGNHKKHSRLTVTCEDGSAPEYSLHGSTYCWSNSVCPTSTVCVQGLCCATGPNNSIQRLCSSSNWECLDGKCLSMSQRCDGYTDCSDGGDELFCLGNEKRSVVSSTGQCASEEFRCDDGACIPQNRQCDRHYDCSDGSDETKCGYYVEAMKAHANQTQDHGHNDHQQADTPRKSKCQHHASHHESSHHAHARDPNIECTDQEFRCPYLTEVKCFHYDKLCDGVDDCGDGSDEVNCESGSKEEKDEVEPSAEAASDNEGCTSNQFKCDDGRCIESSLACNHKYDCDDGTDETHCEYFKAAMARRAESTTDNEHNNVDNNNNNNNVNNNNNNHEAELRRREEELRRREHEESRRQEELKRREEAEHQREEELRHREDSERDREDELRHREDELRRREDEERRRHEEERRQEDEDRRRDDEHRQHQEQERRRLHEEQVRRQEEEDRRNNEDALRRQHEQHSRRQEEESRHNQEEIRRRQEQAQEAHEQEERRRLEEHRRQLEEERSRVHELPKPIHHPHEDSTGISNEVIFKEYEDEVLCLDHEFACGTGECIDRRRVCDTRPDCLDSSDEDNCADRRPEDLPAFHEHIEDEIVDEEDQVPQIANGHIQPHHHESYDDRIAQEHQMEMHPAQPSQPMRQHEHQSATYYHQDIDQSGANDVQITIYPTEASVRDGRDVTFDCRARTADNSVYPSVRWTRAGGPLPPNAHETGGRLTLNPVSLEDSGRYICTATHNGQTVEAHSILNVQSYGPQDVQGLMPNNGACMADEKACGNNECVKAEYVCDGEPDCRDRSDEENCPALRSCEPNEFKCANQRCVQKMWLCDGDDDCGDGSDELNCGGQQPGDLCKATEFQCADRRQCVPTSFHCDGTNDCRDGSDEVGCVQPTVVEPPETNKQVPIGETFRLTCKAVGVPEPYINWRLNWGPVCEPPRCLQSSEGGQGTLTVTNAQPADQGAYTCEAINVKGRVLATPDCIVRIVNIPSPTLPPRPAPTPSCDTRGSVSPYPDGQGNCQCKPQVTGPNCDTCRPGSFHLSPKSPQGCLKCFCFGITDQCRSSSYYRTKDRLMFDGDAEGVTISDIGEREIDRNSNFEFTKQGYLTLSGAPTGTKYWRLPQRFLGDKVTAYGGKMEFEVEYSGSGSLSQEPLVVLKGNQMILVHRVRNQDQVLRSDSPVRITVETYETSYEQLNGAPATREDLLMVLADLDAFLIRATHTDSQYTSSLGDVSWEIAVDRQTQDGMALEVEQCSCPPGYIGTSCEDCAPGYERSGHGPFLGTCVPMQQRTPQCTGVGAASPQAGYGGRCQCKTYAQGPNCDQCAANSFYMAPSNPQGCIPCFCSGVTQQCQSSSYSRTNVEIDYRRGDRDQLTLSSSDSRQPFTPQTPGYVSGSAIEFSSFHEANGQTLYWKMPEKFLGNKVTAYGGNLKFTFRYSGEGNTNRDPHIILRGNDISLQYTHREPTSPDRDNTIEIKLFEDKWQRVDGQQATREHLLMALADLDSLLIKATYIDDCSQSSLIHVSFEFAEPYGRGGMTALEVEQCQCPPGYVGTSCEDCAPGYSRTGGGLYLGLCEKCECHGHASTCDKEYGFCVDCQHNTEGDQCHRCKPGFVGDARRGTPHDCQPAATRPPCQCNNHSPRGCDSFGRCLLCEHNTEGTHCERCKKGFYGDATKGTPFDCTPCPCPGTSDCYLDQQGQVACRNCPAGLSGRLCNECAPGYTRSNKEAGRICEPIGSVTNNDRTYVPSPPEALRVRILEPKYQYLKPGQKVQWICQIIGQIPTNVRLEWTRVGHAKLPSKAFTDEGYLSMDDVQEEDEGQYRCTATTVTSIATDDAILTLSRQSSGRPPQPHIDPPHQTVMEGDAASFRCWVPEIPDCQITFHKEHIGGPLPHGVYQTGNALKIPRAMLKDAGNYICTAINQYGIGQSPNARLDVIRPAQRPKVDPIEQTVNEGEPARFRCWVPGNNDVQLKWNRIGNQPLPSGVQEQQGILYIPSTSHNEIGQYVCTATDPKDGKPQESDPVSLNLRKPDAPPQLPQVDPPEQTVNEGDPAQFRCWVPGNPHAQLRWTKESGEALPEGTLERDGYLRLNNAQMSDAGRYICTATDPRTGAPSQAPPATLNVKKDAAPIVPQVDPQEQTVNEGEPSRIRCFVPGNPEIQLRWTKERRQPLQQGASERDGVLTISKTMKEDEGNYLCMAIDPNTRQPIEAPLAKINVKAPLKPLVDPSEQTIPEGSPFRIRCWVPGHPDAELSWRKAEGTVNDLADERQGHLTVHQAQQTDDGDYICSVNDPTTGEPIDSDPATVHVTSTAKPPVVDMSDKSPEISPPHQKVPTGDDVTIKCWVEGDPAAQLTFTRVDGTPLPFGSSEQNGILSIPNAQPADEGDYVCTYHPSEGQPKESTISRLDVESKGQPPRPVASPAVQTVRRGTPARFTCVAHSATPARISWTFGDETTPLPSEVRRDGDDIIIDQATEHLVGSYVCTATNHFGRGVAEPVRLEITDDEQPPTARVEPRTWNGKPGDRHQFKCIVTGVPTPKVVWTGPNGTPLPHDVTPLEDNILDFAHGRTELNGDYTCTATNPVGEASDHGVVNIGPSLTVKTTPAGPRLVLTVGEPLLVKCEAFGEPEPEVEWLHDPGPERGDLPDDYKPVTISEQFIRHPAIGLGNAGLYTCKGSNSHATATKDIYIEVVEPSRVATVSILGGSTQWFEQGEPSELICTATGSSLVDRLEWVKVDDQLPTDVEEHNEPGLLHFPNFKNSYAGEYECRGYRHDELIATSAVTVHSASLGQDDAKVEVDPPRVRVINQGDSIVLRCSVTGAKNGENFEWALLRGGNIVRKLGTEATLTINKADPTNDFGVYRCNVEDDNGMVIGSAYTAVTVGYSNKQNAQITKFDEHSDASFVCPVYSVPGSKVEWSRDDGELPSNAQPNGNKLEIKDFDDKSSGLYICSVHINDRVVEGYVHAQIFVPDTIIQVLLEVSSENINVGERAWFDCKVTGDPSAQISWYKDGADELPENSQEDIIHWFDAVCNRTVTGGRLLFTDITEDNAGTYRCVAKTKAGPLETRTVLNVGAAKRKRKHARRGRHARHQTRHAAYEAKEKEKQRSMFEETPISSKQLIPIQKVIGDDAYLSCNAPSTSHSANWTRLDGKELSDKAVVNWGVLNIPKLQREDEGLYACIARQDGNTSSNHVYLQIDDFVPVFTGKEVIEMDPITDEQMENFDVKVTLKPSDENGVLFSTSRRGDVNGGTDQIVDRRPPVIEHNTKLRDNFVVYQYDVGYGKDEIVSAEPLDLNDWNVIEVTNTDDKATIRINNGRTIEKEHGPVVKRPGSNNKFVIGGLTLDQEARKDLDDIKRYEGIVSEVSVSGEPMNLGKGVRISSMGRYDACTLRQPCANDAQCRITNRQKGYTCVCNGGFDGEHCQLKSSTCKDEFCHAGICLEEDDMWQCVCPANTTGLRCEKEIDPPDSLAFLYDTSFFSVQAPKNIDDFQITTKFTPQSVSEEHILMYVASNYDSSSKKHMSISIIDNVLLYNFENGPGICHQLRSSNLQEGEEYEMTLARTNGQTNLIVNGQQFVISSSPSSFEPGTDLFIGGLPPGVSTPASVPETSFKGCITQIVLNGKKIEFNDPTSYRSGDIASCNAPPTENPVDEGVGGTWDDEDDSEVEGEVEATTTNVPEEANEQGEQTIDDEAESTTGDEVIIYSAEKSNEEAHEVEKSETENPTGEEGEKSETEETGEDGEEIEEPTETTTTTTMEPMETTTTEETFHLYETQKDDGLDLIEIPPNEPTSTLSEEDEYPVSTEEVNPTELTTDQTTVTDVDDVDDQVDAQEQEQELNVEDEEMSNKYDVSSTTNEKPIENENEKSEDVNTSTVGVDEEPNVEDDEEDDEENEELEEDEAVEWSTSSDDQLNELLTTTTAPVDEVQEDDEESLSDVDEAEELETTDPDEGDVVELLPTDPDFTLDELEGSMPKQLFSTSVPKVASPTEECPSTGCLSEVCKTADCGINGKCLEFNETHYECVCNLFYDGPRCNIFKPIEHAAKFNGNAFIELSADEFPHLTSEKDEVVELRFKTEHPNGVIFWQGQQPGTSVVGEDYISLGLTNGYLHFSYELGGGAANMVSPIRLNDGKMHVVKLERRGRRGSLQIDGERSIVGMSSGILAMLNAEGNIFIGGVPDLQYATGGLHHQNFVGCIADVALNGEKVDLMGTAIDGKNVRPCEEWIVPKRWLKKRRRT